MSTIVNPPEVQNMAGIITFLFSGIALLLVNLVVTGELLAYLLGLSDSGDSKINIKIKEALHLGTKGDKFIAGLAAYTVSLLVVGIYLTPYAKTIFMINLELTDQMRIACQLLATSIAVVFCLAICSVKLVVINIKAVMRKPPGAPPDDQERANSIIR